MVLMQLLHKSCSVLIPPIYSVDGAVAGVGRFEGGVANEVKAAGSTVIPFFRSTFVFKIFLQAAE